MPFKDQFVYGLFTIFGFNLSNFVPSTGAVNIFCVCIDSVCTHYCAIVLQDQIRVTMCVMVL